ncbi:MAG: hypothetical protein E3J72_16790 [Planctomycetota bacterium]|nr:MAG: hypothetical protein E3J72_16790 [Planctomycetota bacterium]
MRTAFSITFRDDGRLQIGVSGKLTGHAAREGLELLQMVVAEGKREILLDLRETTSLDSLGIGIFDWIRSQNGNLDFDVLLPVRGVSEDELEYISLGKTSANRIERRRYVS